MRLSSISVRIESGDNVDVHYAPARVTRFSDGYEMPVPPMAHVYVGEVHLFGPPAAVVEVLGRALKEAYAACGDGNPDGSDDGPSGPATAVHASGGGER